MERLLVVGGYTIESEKEYIIKNSKKINSLSIVELTDALQRRRINTITSSASLRERLLAEINKRLLSLL